jgi:hypothetical protein
LREDIFFGSGFGVSVLICQPWSSADYGLRDSITVYFVQRRCYLLRCLIAASVVLGELDGSVVRYIINESRAINICASSLLQDLRPPYCLGYFADYADYLALGISETSVKIVEFFSNSRCGLIKDVCSRCCLSQ